MLIEEELAPFAADKDMALTIGVFDGVHLGHKHLITSLIEMARSAKLLSGVVTFKRHPLEVLSPGKTLLYLTSLDEKTRLLKQEGVDAVIPLTFTPELCDLSARQFMELLVKNLRMRLLLAGPDFALGKNREGDTANLAKLGEELGFRVVVLPPFQLDGEVVSSTAIRQALAAGDMRRAARLLGRPFKLEGRVTGGTGRGAGLGFPTANLDTFPAQALPAEGVYATRSYINGKSYPSMTNIGRCPTFGGDGCTIETYIMDYSGNLYGRELRVEVIERLRDEKKFASEAELKKQIAQDIARGRTILGK